MRLVLATRNAHKAVEIRALLADLPLEVRSPADYPEIPDVEETGATFAENADLKAQAIAAATGQLALADDSGLVVDALDGAPGIYSSRFAGPGATDQQKNEKLLALLKDVPESQRAARFVAAVSIASPDGRVQSVTATCEGRIAFAPRGEHGFGYDPVFLLPDRGLTMAELHPEEKNRISHRAQAMTQAREILRVWIDGTAGGPRAETPAQRPAGGQTLPDQQRGSDSRTVESDSVTSQITSSDAPQHAVT